MKHLRDARVSARAWCGREGDRTEDPHRGECVDCLREAATYGAKAAMRCAAVEAGASRDPELIAERDEAIKQLNAMREALRDQAALFVCQGCSRVHTIRDVAYNIGGMSWCLRCSPETVQ